MAALGRAPWDRIGGRGRKLQALGERWETRSYIWEMRDCWACVSLLFRR